MQKWYKFCGLSFSNTESAAFPSIYSKLNIFGFGIVDWKKNKNGAINKENRC